LVQDEFVPLEYPATTLVMIAAKSLVPDAA
jgi:hypothetical protein